MNSKYISGSSIINWRKQHHLPASNIKTKSYYQFNQFHHKLSELSKYQSTILRRKSEYNKPQSYIDNNTESPHKNLQREMNNQEIGNASRLINESSTNNDTINNNTLNNIASHSNGIEKHIPRKKVPHNFYQSSYNHERYLQRKEFGNDKIRGVGKKRDRKPQRIHAKRKYLKSSYKNNGQQYQQQLYNNSITR